MLTAGFRIFYSVLAALSVPYLSLQAFLISGNLFADHLMQRSDGISYRLLGVFQRFDTLIYVHIAQSGYDVPQTIVFPPLYPLLIRFCTLGFRNPLVSAIVISTAATFFLFWGLLKLFRLDAPDSTAVRGVLLYAALPTSFMFFLGYPDSLMIALTVWAIYSARSGRWWLAGVLGFLAPLAKFVGCLVAVPLLVIALRETRVRRLAAALPMVGAFSFFAWLKLSGHQLPSEIYSLYWKTEVAWPWTTIWHCLRSAWHLLRLPQDTSPLITIASVGFALLYVLQLFVIAITAIFALSKRLRLEYLIYSVAVLCFLFTKDSVVSQQQWARYALVLFPGALNFAAREQDRLIYAVSTGFFFLLNLLLMWLFLQWMLVA
jgi:hypothetical protein